MNDREKKPERLTEQRDRIIVRTSAIGILVNVLLAAFKAAVGVASHSIAVNPAAEQYGRVVGTNCAKGCPALKAGLCRQAQMGKKEKATWIHLPDGGKGHPSTSYWIPVAGHPDYYFHFGIGITIDYAKNPTEEQ